MKNVALSTIAVLAVFTSAAFASDAGDAGDAGSVADARGRADGGPIVIPPDMMPRPGAPVARSSVGVQTVELGRSFSLFISVEHRSGVEVNIPSALQLGDAFEERRRTYRDRELSSGGRVREYELEVIAWQAGDQQIGPISVTYVADGEARTTMAPPVAISVSSVIGAGKEALRDIAPPVEVLGRDWSLLWIVGSIVVGIGLLGCVFFLRSRRRSRLASRSRAARKEPPRTPLQLALHRLTELEQSGALEREQRKPAFAQMSEIIRDYLGVHFRFAALDSTTAEIRRHLAARPGGAEVLEILEDWLAVVDLVKYASHPATRDEAIDALNDARRIISRCSSPPTSPSSSASESERASGLVSVAAPEREVSAPGQVVAGPEQAVDIAERGLDTPSGDADA